MSHVSATYVSVWDGGTEIRTACKYDPEANLVFDVEAADVGGLESLEDEFIELDDGAVVRRADFRMEGDEDG
jgi:hypothetical protein